MTTRIERNTPATAQTVQQPRPEAPVARTETPRPAATSGFDAARAASPVALSGPAQAHVALPNLNPGVAAQTLTGTATPKAAIGDNSKLVSTILIDGNVNVEKLTVDLGIAHSYRGDLVVSLTSPSGKTAVLSDRAGGSADDLRTALSLADFAGESSQGEWKLTVEDKGRGDVGTLESWGLEIAGEPKAPPPPPESVISKSASPNVAIPDNQTVKSTLEVTEDVGVEKLNLDLDIAHSYRGDLVVKLTSPSGKTAVVSEKQGGSADDLKGRFDLSAFAGESAKGTWTLEVTDTATQDTGTLKSWGLEITPKADVPPPPPPPGDDTDPMKHIEILASDEMRGRDSPSAEYDKASVYVRDFLQKYGLKGPNAADPQSPFFQTFDMFSFDPGRAAREHDEPHSLDPKDFSHELFEGAHYLDGTLGPDQLKVLNERYRDSIKERGEVPTRGSGPNGDLTAEELRTVSQRAGTVQNVMGMLEGTGPNKNEVIVVMAHLDHVGVNRSGQVFNGADDNASGSATLLASVPELVALQKEGKLDRSIVFLWTAAEEQGLVGAQYFVDHPIPGLGLKEISGVVNMDMVGRWDDQRLSILDTTNGKPNYFRDVLEKANNSLADPFDKLNRDINAFRDRQDGAIFSRKGEDVLMLFEGLSNPNGGGQLIPEYHGTGDDIDKIIRDNGGNKPRRVKDLFVQIAQLAANRPAAAAPAETSRRAPAPQPATVVWR